MSVTLLTPEDIEGIVANAVSKTLLNVGYVHPDTLLDTMAAAKVLGLDVNAKIGTINQAMNRFCKDYTPNLRKYKIGDTKYKMSELQEFIKSHQL
jgi:hypothetical protein